MPQTLHQPVMLEQAIGALQPHPGGSYIDLTVGAGGHARRILEASQPDGRLLALDRDPEAIEAAATNLSGFGDRLRLVHGRFSELPHLLAAAGFEAVDGMLADLGVSSLQLDRAERGFSFQRPGPLDMRMDPTSDRPLAELLQGMGVAELAEALHAFGEVHQARKLAGRILDAVQRGAMDDTVQLGRLAAEGERRGRLHPATRVFLALRMLVNRELEELNVLVGRLPEPLKIGGRVVFIAFHSVEDRCIKQRLAVLKGGCLCPPGLPVCTCGRSVVMRPLSGGALQPSLQEVARNPRARSARLRAAERLAA